MTEERLKEIKDSIDFKREYYNAIQKEDFLFDEELELYNEVVRLRKIVDDIRKYTRTFDVLKIPTKQLCIFNDIFLIIEGRKDEVERLNQNNLTVEQLTGIENE